MKRKFLSFLLVIAVFISSVNALGMVVFAAEYPELTLGEGVVVIADEITYTFTTEEAGPYVAFSQGDGYLFASINDEDGRSVTTAYQNAQDGKGFRIETVLAKNSVYTIEVYNRFPDSVATNYELTVDKRGFDGNLQIDFETEVEKVETFHSFTPTQSGYYFICTTGQEDTYGQLFDESGNCLYYDDNMAIDANYRLEYYLNANETYTVYTKIWGAPETFDVGLCVVPFESEARVEENEVYTITDRWGILTFVPQKTATYRFYSTAEEGIETSYYGNVYNSDFEKVSYINEEIYSDSNFYAECDLVAGQTYYLDAITLWSSELSPQTFDVTICEVSPITELSIVPLDGTVAGINQDLHCELVIQPEVHKTEEIYWYIEPERVGRIEYGDKTGASIELHSPGVAEVTAVTESGVSTSYRITCEGDLPELTTNVTSRAYMEGEWEIHSYIFTAQEEGSYGVLSRGDELDLKVALYEYDDIYPLKTETHKGSGDNFNLQFYNLNPGTTYIVEVTTDYDEEDYNSHSGNYEIMAYRCTDQIEGVELSVGENFTAYTDVDYYEFSVSLLPETADQSALESATWNLSGDEIGWCYLYGRNYVWYRFNQSGTATLTASVCDGRFTDSCVITGKEAGYNNILLDEVKTIRVGDHYSEGWFRFVPEESGSYTFYSTGDVDVDMYSNDESCDWDSGYAMNFFYTVELSAGEEFVFECVPYSDNDNMQYWVSVCKTHVAQSVKIVEDLLTVKEKYEYGYYYAVMGNGGATYDLYSLTWTLSDESVAEFSYYGDDGVMLYFVGEGVTTLTVSAPDGFNDSIDIYVGVEPPQEEPIPGDVDGDGQIGASDLVDIRKVLLSDDANSSVCDVTGDGLVNIKDLIRLKKFLLGEAVLGR